MKILNGTIILSIFILNLSFNSCTKEAGIKEADKLSSADCPRLASLTTEKKETLYTVSTYAGIDLPYNNIVVDGVLCKARFGAPWGITISHDGSIYISDRFIHNIRKINNKGIVSTFAGDPVGGNYGDEDGIGTKARLCGPREIVLNKEGNLLVIDQTCNEGAIRIISPSAQVSTFISNTRDYGYQDGPLAQAKFGIFLALASGPDGSIYLYEPNNLIRKISPEGMVSTYAGQKPINDQIQRGYQDGLKENALFEGITDMTFGPDGSLYVCDYYNNKIRRITTSGHVETFADVDANSIAISENGIVFASSGQQIYKINPSGTVQIIAGNYATSEYKDGVGTQARFEYIVNLAVHKNYLYMTDGSMIRRMNIE